MKRKSFCCYMLVLLMCMSLLPVLPEQGKVAEAESKDLVLHMNFDDNLEDSSGYSNNGDCTYGNITYEKGIFGNCAVFDGKSYIEVQDDDTLDLKDSFTISLWAYKEKSNDYVPFVYKEEDEECWAPPYKLYEHWMNSPTIFLHDNGDETELNQFMLEGNVIDIRKWFLLTVTYNGEEVRIYHNKQLIEKKSVTGVPTATVGNLFIGMLNGLDGAIYYKGKMDDLRIYTTALSANEVGTLYDNGVSSNPDYLKQTNALVAHYKFENNFKDTTEYGNDAEKVTGEGTIKFVDALNGKGAKFSKGSYLEVEDNDTINFDEGFSLTGWVCVAKEGLTMPILNRVGVSNSSASNDIAYGFAAYDNGYGFFYTPFTYNYATESNYLSFDNSTKNRWYHVGVTFDGEQIRWYKNGKLAQKEELDGLEIAHADGSLMIGSDGENFLEGSLDELKLYNYALSADEVKADTNRIDSIFISQSNQNSLKALKEKDTLVIKTSRKYIEDGSTEELSSGVSYKTSNKKIFTVSKDGKITAVDRGKAKLTITHGGISKTYAVTVK